MSFLPTEPLDLLVIGGGINGLGIAADAAARGLRTLIVERGDWGGGTTSASSRLIHGGLRYLQYGEIDLVRESLRERGVLARQRPHLVRPMSLLIPTFAGQRPGRAMIGAGLFLYDLLARDPRFARPAILGREQTRKREPGLTVEGLTGGFTYPDAQIEFPERLCVDLRRAVVEAGGAAWNHAEVVALRQESDGAAIGATVRDTLTGETVDIDAALTVNAAGPWLDAVNRTLGKYAPPRSIGGTWGTHVILPARAEGPTGPVYATAQRDGRPFFLLPWDGRLLVGTTDIKFEGDNPDTLEIADWEIPYLLDETNRLFPGAEYLSDDVQATTVGIRPLPATEGRRAGAITRRHFLVDHAAQHGVRGLASIVGGKLTTYRRLAEEVVDAALRLLGRPPVPCPTRAIAPETPTVAALHTEAAATLIELHLPVGHADRLVALYGPAFANVLARVREDPSLGRRLGPTAPDLEAQVVHAVESEQARTLGDIVRRRLMRVPASDELVAGLRRVVKSRNLGISEG